VGEEVPIRVTSGAIDDPVPPDAAGRSSQRGVSLRRVVREPGRRARAITFVALAGLVAGGLLVGRDGGRDGRDGGSGERPPADTARVAYDEAVLRLGRARSFAYRGSVHAAGFSPMRPGTWLAADVTVEGAVLLPRSITREVAVDASGRAAETVTSGPTAWSRTAPGAGELAGAPWDTVRWPDQIPLPPYDTTGPNRLGIALVADVVRSAGSRRADPPDATGRRTLHATAPTDVRDERYGDLLAGAEVSLALDEAGDIAHVVVTSGPADDPQLVVELAIERLGEPQLITPADVGDPARRSVPLDVFDAAGVEALELGQVPDGWALTDARAPGGGTVRMKEGCPRLGLDYRDLGAVSGGWLSLGVTSDRCLAQDDHRGVALGEPFRTGSFSGWAEEGSTQTRGLVSDGVTTVSFSTDLSTADAAVMLASLAPFDVAAQPVPIGDVPSS
jgi:hypothetical protein